MNSNSRATPREKPICHLVISTTSANLDIRLKRHFNVYLAQNGGLPDNTAKTFRTFRTSNTLVYEPFCDDFGPMNAVSIFRFIEMLDAEIKIPSDGLSNIVYCADNGKRSLTNAAFLLGSYMILKLNMQPLDVALSFHGLEANLFEPFRDASNGTPTFGLELIDCWQGLFRGKQKGWIAPASKQDPAVWGMIDADSYVHYDNPLNADLHEIVPGKLIVFRGPKDLGGREFCNHCSNGGFKYRQFSPEYYLDILQSFGVRSIVRLNPREYDESVFVSNGFRHYDLPCAEECSTPPPALVSRFFKVVDEGRGAVAVHGASSFGRAGTLAALFLMRSHEFTAREAMAWVRIMRPGSIVGSQQHYLCTIEKSIAKLVTFLSPNAASVPSPTPLQQLPPPQKAPPSASPSSSQESGTARNAEKARAALRHATHSYSLADLSSAHAGSRPSAGSVHKGESPSPSARAGMPPLVGVADPDSARVALKARRSNSVVNLFGDDCSHQKALAASSPRDRRGSLSFGGSFAGRSMHARQ